MNSIFTLQHTIDEVENLIKKHEAFEKAAAAQEERFVALERLTTVNIHRALFQIFIILELRKCFYNFYHCDYIFIPTV